MAAVATITLRDLIDIAISSTDPGLVNFNVLREILDVVLKETNLQNKKIDFQLPVRPDYSCAKQLPFLPTDQVTLIDRITKLEDALQNIVGLPTNKELLESNSPQAASRRPVADLYQSIKVTGRIESLENALAKMASLVDDILQKNSGVEHVTQDFETEMKELQEKLSSYGPPDTPEVEIATWDGLYAAIEGREMVASGKPEDPKRKKVSLEEAQTAKKKRKTTSEERKREVTGTDKQIQRPEKAEASTETDSQKISEAGIATEKMPKVNDSRDLVSSLLREMRESQHNLDLRIENLAVLVDTKADKKDLVNRLEQANADVEVHAARTEQAFQEIRTLRADLDGLAAAFDEYAAMRRHRIRQSTVAQTPFNPTGAQIPFNSTSTEQTRQGVVGKRSQACTAFGTAVLRECPVGTPVEPVISEIAIASSLLKLQNSRLDSIDKQLENFRKHSEELKHFLDEQIVNLAEKHNSLEQGVQDVIRMFKERRRPNLKVSNLDMNMVEKMLDDYEQIIDDMKIYDKFGKCIEQKSDRLFQLVDDLKRNKADSRMVRDALEVKADVDSLREKASRLAMENLEVSVAAQLEAVSRQVTCNETFVKSELGKFLETLGTRAAYESVDELRDFVQDLSNTMNSVILNARIPKRSAAATNCNLQCLSCGDDVYQEPRNETSLYQCFSPRETMAPYATFGRSKIQGSSANRCTPRRTSVSPNSRCEPLRPTIPTLRSYREQIDERHIELLRQAELVRRIGATETNQATTTARPPSLPNLSATQTIINHGQPSTAKKKLGYKSSKSGRGCR